MTPTEYWSSIVRKCSKPPAIPYGWSADIVSGILDKSDYKALNASYSDDKKRLENAVKQLEAELDECKNNTSKKLQWVERFKAFENIDKIDRNVVVQLIECIHIYDKTYLQITFNFKDEYEQALSALKEYVEVV